jgi:HD-GYP domain-containing protein (c-di-GMP phosphodiesterase class II)
MPVATLKAAEPTPCVVCRLPLPIRPATTQEVAQYWCCTRCGTKHLCMLLENPPAECQQNVRSPDGHTPSAPATRDHQSLRAPQGVATKPLPDRESVVCRLETQLSRGIDQVVTAGQQLSVTSDGPPFLSRFKTHGTRFYDPGAEEKLVAQYDDSLEQLESLVASLENGQSIDPESSKTIVRETLVKATDDLDLFVRLGINPPSGAYPSRHSLHVAMLAASVGANLGWDENTLVELGVGCLLHDVGMLRVPDQMYYSGRVLGDSEFGEIAKHPLHTFELLAQEFERVPLASRMVAYQMHERCDGSGYPRNRRGGLIHEAAKVAAVADVYVALVSSRPHRPALMPYSAMEHLLAGVKQGTFDSAAVRALLTTISLFPIGSYLALKDGRIGRVLRANREHYARPIIETWWPDGLDRPPQVVDLSKVSQIEIQGPLPRLSSP